jgi:hypothetical protein
LCTCRTIADANPSNLESFNLMNPNTTLTDDYHMIYQLRSAT